MIERLKPAFRLAAILATVFVYFGIGESPVVNGGKPPKIIGDCGTYGGGDYALGKDVEAPPGTDTCLIFKKSKTTVDMRGHTVKCNPGLPFGNRLGIRVLGGESTITSSTGTNGTVTNCQAGIELNGSGHHTLSNVTATNNCDGVHVESGGNVVTNDNASNNLCQGIVIEGDTNTVQYSQFDGNGCNGINIDSGGDIVTKGSNTTVVPQTIQFNTANNNDPSGIASADCGRGIIIYNDLNGLQTLNVVRNNTATGNFYFDLEDDNPSCDTNTWSSNAFGTSSSDTACIQ